MNVGDRSISQLLNEIHTRDSSPNSSHSLPNDIDIDIFLDQFETEEQLNNKLMNLSSDYKPSYFCGIYGSYFIPNPLIIAAENDDNQLVSKLLQQNTININQKDFKNDTALLVASRKGHYTVVQTLLDYNYTNANTTNTPLDINATGSDLEGTAMYYACTNNYANIVRLLTQYGADLNIPNPKTGSSPLFVACSHNNYEIAKFLIDHHAEIHTNNKYGVTPFMFAAIKGNIDMLNLFLKHDTFRGLNHLDENKRTALYHAADNQHTEIVRILISEPNIQIDIVSKWGTALYVACSKGYVEIVEILLAHNADVNRLTPSKYGTLFRAIANKHANIVKLLLTHNADPNMLNGEDEWCPLLKASRDNCIDCVELLLTHKDIQVNKANKNVWWNPLLIASYFNHVKVVEMLLAHDSIDIDFKNRNGDTALVKACDRNCLETVQLLLKHGANINMTTNDGFSPLMRAARNARFDILKVLLQHPELDVEYINSNGDDAISVARHIQDHAQMASLITEKMKEVIELRKKNKKNWAQIECGLYQMFDPLWPTIIRKIIKKYNIRNDDLSSKTITTVVDTLHTKYKKKVQLTDDHCKYLIFIIEKLRDLKYPIRRKQRDIDPKQRESASLQKLKHDLKSDLNLEVDTSMLLDIFMVHNLFMHSVTKMCTFEYLKDIFDDGNHSNICLSFNPIQYPPKYVIQDNMESIMQYIFATTYFVNELRNNAHARNETDETAIDPNVVNIIIIPHKLSSIIKPEEDHLKYSNIIPFEQIAQIKNSSSMNANRIYEDFMKDWMFKNESRPNTIYFVVDKRNSDCDELYLISDDYKHETLTEIKSCGLNMRFAINYERNVIKSYIGFIGEESRFFPQFIVSLIPALFDKRMFNDDFAAMYHMFYSNNIRNGFGVDLYDPDFNKVYKRITGYDHVTINYDRQITVFNGDNVYYRYNPNEIRIANEHKCEEGNTDLSKCTFSMYLVQILKSTKVIHKNDGILNVDKYKTISLCWDHLIRVHSLFHEEDTTKSKIVQYFRLKCGGVCNCDDIDLKARENVNGAEDSLFDYLRFHKLSSVSITAIQQWIYANEYDSDSLRDDIADDHDSNLHNYIVDEMHIKKQYIHLIQRHFNIKSVDSVDEAISILHDTIHYYLLHDASVSLRINGDNDANGDNKGHFASIVKKETSETKDITFYNIDFGQSVLCWLNYKEKPTFNSFAEEIIHNPASTINAELFKWFEKECKLKYDNPDINNIRYTMNELMALKMYSDTNDYQSALRRAHWRSKTQKFKQMKHNFYHWAMVLYQCFLYSSQPPKPMRNKPRIPCYLYHGLDCVLVLDNILPFYNGIFSSSMSFNVANQFCKESGLLFTICPSYSNPFMFVSGIASQWFSAYPNENEFLLFNQYIPIKSTMNFCKSDKDKVNLIIEQLKRYKKSILSLKYFCVRIGIAFKAEWLPIFKMHPDLNSHTLAENEYPVIGRLIHELKIPKDTFDDDNVYIRSLKALQVKNGCLKLKEDTKLNSINYSIRYILASNVETSEQFTNKQFILLNSACIKYHIFMNDVCLQRDAKIVENENISVSEPERICVIHDKKTVQPILSEKGNRNIQIRAKKLIIDEGGVMSCIACGNCQIGKGETKQIKAEYFHYGGAGFAAAGEDYVSSSGGPSYGGNALQNLYYGSVSGHSESKAGGIIELIVDEEVINNGKICCCSLGSYGASGGSIKITTSKLTNNGIICCYGATKSDLHRTGAGSCGRIAIYCNKYVNEGTVYPTPYVTNIIDTFTHIIEDGEEPDLILLNNDEHNEDDDDEKELKEEIVEIPKYTYSAKVDQNSFFHILHESPAVYQYTANSLIISTRIDILPFDKSTYFGGCLQIRCLDTFTIKKNGVLNGAGCGYYYGCNVPQLDHNNSNNILQFGAGIKSGESRGGGIIQIIAKTFINQGHITCGGVKHGNGGSIHIIAQQFINQGTIDADGTITGKIHIICEQYTNEEHAVIHPKPTVTTNRYDENELEFNLIDHYLPKKDAMLLSETELNHHQIVGQLVKQKNVDVNQTKVNTPLYIAAKLGFTMCVWHLLSRDDIQINQSRTSDQQSPLLIAAGNKRYDIVKLLLLHSEKMKAKDIKHGILNINQQSTHGSTAFYAACEGGSLKIAQILAQYGAAINMAPNGGFTPLHRVCCRRYVDIVTFLLAQKEIQVNKQDIAKKDKKGQTNGGRTALWAAVWMHSTECVKLLLSHPDIDVNLASDLGTTPLYTASEQNVVDIVDLLLKHGADVNLSNNHGVNPLHRSCAKGFVGITKKLLEHKHIDVYRATDNNSTALSLAASVGHFEIVQLLLHKMMNVSPEKVINSDDSTEKRIEILFEEAIKQKPNDGYQYMAFGDYYAYLKKDDKALDAYESSFKVAPQNVSYINFGKRYAALEMYSKAINVAQNGLKKDPKNMHLFNNLGWYHYKAGDSDKAIQVTLDGLQYDNDIETGPQSNMLENLAFYYTEKGYNDKAVSITTKILDRLKTTKAHAESNVRFTKKLGLCYVVMSNIDDAVETHFKLHRIPQLNIRDTAIIDQMHEMGHDRYVDKRYDSAEQYLRGVLRVNPSRKRTNGTLANTLFALKRYDEAIPFFVKSLNMESDLRHKDVGPVCVKNFIFILLQIGEFKMIHNIVRKLRKRNDFEDRFQSKDEFYHMFNELSKKRWNMSILIKQLLQCDTLLLATNEKLRLYLSQNGYDSDAIEYDVDNEDDTDSNIYNLLKANQSEDIFQTIAKYVDVSFDDNEDDKKQDCDSIICVCGSVLQEYKVRDVYPSHKANCDLCRTRIDGTNEMVYHCADDTNKRHPKGYDVCVDCAHDDKLIEFTVDTDSLYFKILMHSVQSLAANPSKYNLYLNISELTSFKDPLMDWLRSNNANVVSMHRNKSEEIRCVSSLEKGAILMKIPLKCMMTVNDAKISVIGKNIESLKKADISDTTYLAAYLLEQRNKEQRSCFAPFIKQLSAAGVTQDMMVYFDEEQQRLLEGTYALVRINEEIKTCSEQYHLIQKVVKFENITFADFVWAHLMIKKRAIEICMNNKNILTLVPFVKHKSNQNTVQWMYDDDNKLLIISATKPMKSNEAIYKDNGSTSDTDNIYNAVGIMMPLRIFATKSDLMKSLMKKRKHQSFIIQDKYENDCIAMFGMARLSSCNETEMKTLQEVKQFEEISVLNKRNETNAIKLISQCAVFMLNEFKTSLAQDIQLLSDTSLYPRNSDERHLLILRKREKELLHIYASLYSDWIRLNRLKLPEYVC